MTVPLKDMKVGHRYLVKYGYERPGGYKRRKLYQGVATLVKKGRGGTAGYPYRSPEPHRFELPDGTKVWVSLQSVLSHEGEDPIVARRKSLDKEIPKKKRKQIISETLMYLSAFNLSATRDADDSSLTFDIHNLEEFNQLLVKLMAKELESA